MPVNDLTSLDNLTTSPGPAPNRRRREIPAPVLPLALLLGFLLLFGLLFGNRLIPAVPVQVAPVITIRSDQPAPLSSVRESASSVPEPLPLLFQASGWIEPDPFSISVPALVGGIVDEVFVLEGESVKKGQRLATLIDDEAKLDLDEAKSRVATLRSQIAAHKSRIPMVESKRSGFEKNIASQKIKLAELVDKLERLRSLPKGSIPQIELKSAELQVKQQEALVDQAATDLPTVDSELETIRLETITKENQLREAEVAVAKAQLALDRHTVFSPMDGIVLALHAAPGTKRMVHMDNPKSAYIVELFDPAKLQARIDVPLSEASALSVGQPVEMSTDLLPNLELKGVVTRITGEADLQRNTLQVKVAIENPDSRLRPEMLVRGKFYPIIRPVEGGISSTSKRGGNRLAIYVPEAALFGEDRVWVVSPDGTAELRRVSLGTDVRENHRLALEGVRSGEKVILPPHEKLKTGVRVVVKP